MSACQQRKALGKHTHQTGRADLTGERKGRRTQAQALTGHALLSPTPTPPRGHWNQQAICHCAALASLPCPKVCKRLWLEVVLGEGCGRGAFLQPLDVAGLAKQVVLQGVAAAAVLVIELQTAVLGKVKMSSGSKPKNCKSDAKASIPETRGVVL